MSFQKIMQQREVCRVIIDLFLRGKLPLTEREQQMVRIMARDTKVLKDWHLAVLKTFLERCKNETVSEKIC